MAGPGTQTVTITSCGASSIIDLDPNMKLTVMQVTVNAGSCGTNAVQFSLDDPSAANATMTWANLSSAILSSNADGIGATFAVLSPISAVRLTAATTSSVAAAFSGITTLKVLQSVTG